MSTDRTPAPRPADLELTSPRSARVKDIRRLAKRTFRYRHRRFLVESHQAVHEALDEPGVLRELYATAEAESRSEDILQRARSAGVPVYRVTGEVMAEIAQTVTPQGLLGVCGFLDAALGDVLARQPRLVVTMAHVRDPGNAGTVLRAADAAGADAVVFTEASVDPYNGKCVRASAGSLFHLPVVLAGGVPESTEALRGAGLRILAAEGTAERTVEAALDDGTLAAPTAWIFGNEAWGLPAETVRGTDEALRVPIYGRAESLNLASAAAVCLYASARAQRDQPLP